MAQFVAQSEVRLRGSPGWPVSNMAFGRDTAGVHFRRDEIDGILLPDDYSAPAGNYSAPAGNASSEGYERGGYEYSR